MSEKQNLLRGAAATIEFQKWLLEQYKARFGEVDFGIGDSLRDSYADQLRTAADNMDTLNSGAN